ncbi:MAG: hypothetical protein KDC00_06060, partial [Flavobacteriales bacterium]|nr:hypothetical protein [Flavobacteriales bacterium]
MNTLNTSPTRTRRTSWWRPLALWGAVVACLMVPFANAQTITVGTGTSNATGGTNGNPIYRSSAGSTFNFSRSVHLYRAADLTGMPAGAQITQFGWQKNDANTLSAGRTATFNVYMLNTAATSLASGTSWDAMIAGATLVYSNGAEVPPAASGFWDLTLSTPFSYGGNSIMVFSDWAINPGAGNPSTGAFSWVYTAATPSQAIGTSSGSAIPGTQSSWSVPTRMYNARITYSADPCTGTPTPGNTQASVTNGCGTLASSVLSLSGFTPGLGVTYQWQRSLTGGAPWTNFGTSDPTQTVGPLSQTESFQCVVVCTSSGLNNTSTPITLEVNPVPTVNVSASPTGPFCAGDQSTLTATGADTYTWAPATDLDMASGNPVTFTAAATTRTYTVTGTSAAGCPATATVTMTVNTTPVVNSVSASPNPICANGTSVLSVSASDPASSSANLYSFASTTGGTLDPMVGATDLGVSGDDAQSAITNIGFDFYYEAAPYTTFSANSNGSARLDGVVGAGFPAYSNTTAFLTSTLHPLWDDHSANSLSTVLVGTAPNRIRVIHYDLNISFGSPGVMQIWLYEGSNVIEFRYGASAGSSGSATIAIAGADVANFISVTPPSSSSSATRNNAVTGWPGAGTVYTFTPPAATLSALWTPSTYLDDPNLNSPTASNVAATQAYTVTVSNGTCSAQGNVTVTVNPAISGVTLTPASPRYCSGGSVLLTAAPIDGGGPFSYQWTDPNSVAAGTDPTQVANIPGLWSVQITDACLGAPATNSVTVIEDATPTAAALADPACLGQNLQLTGQTDAGPGALFEWNGPNSFTSGAQDPLIPTITAAAGGTYSFTVTSAAPANCVSAESTVSVVVNDAPTITEAASATPDPICAGGSTQLSISATVPGYSVAPIAYAPVSGTGSNGPSGDDAVANAPIGFPFQFFGNTYTDVRISTNGFITFNLAAGSGCCTGNPIPSNDVINDQVALAWEDLTASAGQITYFNLAAPNRFVVDFNNVAYLSGGGSVTGQIILYEDGTIDIVSTSITMGAFDLSTQGVENAGGTVATSSPGRSNAIWTATNDAYRFTANAPAYLWDNAALLNDATIANPIASNVPGNTTFTVTATVGVCSVQSSVLVTADPPPTATATPSPDCGNNQFSVDVNITSTGTGSTAGLSWTVNGAPGAGSPITGLPTGPAAPLGPFAATDEVVVTLLHESNTECDFELGTFYSGCPVVINCAATTNEAFCYGNNETRTYLYATSIPGQTITINFSQGDIDLADAVNIYDGPNNLAPALGGGNFGGSIAGQTFTTTQDSLFIEFVTDGSVSCEDALLANQLQWTVQCTPTDCTAPFGFYDVTVDCNTLDFTVDVQVFDGGTQFFNPQDTVYIIYQVGAAPADTIFHWVFVDPLPVVLGPYPLGTVVNVTLGHETDDACNLILTPATAPYTACPNDEPCDARVAPVNPDYTCVQTVPGDLGLATATAGITNNCGGTPNRDLWYQFETTANVHLIQLQNVSPATGMTMAAYRTPCATPVPVDFACSTTGSMILSGVTIGETILVRVFNTSGALSGATFDFCVSAPPADFIGQNALHFDGTNDRVECGTDASISITGSAITVEAWIYPTAFRTSTFQGSIVNKEGPNLGYALRCGGSGQLSFAVGNG